MDALAVAIGVNISLRNATPRQIFRLSFHFYLFQGLMPILGWMSGNYAAQFMSRFSLCCVRIACFHRGARRCECAAI